MRENLQLLRTSWHTSSTYNNFTRKNNLDNPQTCKLNIRTKGHLPWYLTGGSELASRVTSSRIMHWYRHSLIQSHFFHRRYKGSFRNFSCGEARLHLGSMLPSRSTFTGNLQLLKQCPFTHPVCSHPFTQDLPHSPQSHVQKYICPLYTPVFMQNKISCPHIITHS